MYELNWQQIVMLIVTTLIVTICFIHKTFKWLTQPRKVRPKLSELPHRLTITLRGQSGMTVPELEVKMNELRYRNPNHPLLLQYESERQELLMRVDAEVHKAFRPH